jgi:PadR family transcriptional regulator, regulatory protein PadR
MESSRNRRLDPSYVECYIHGESHMSSRTVSLAVAIILRAVSDGHSYGFAIMEATGLPSGTIYPALRRLEKAGLVRSDCQAAVPPESSGPPRKYFRMTADGGRALQVASGRYPLLASQRK